MAVTDKSIINKIPKQNIPFDKKDEKWRKESIDSYINQSVFVRNSSQYSVIKSYYDYYNGILQKEDYNYVLRPFGGPARKNVPADLKRYNIIKPMIDVLIGEHSRRPDPMTVIAVNADSVTLKEESKQQAINEALTDYFYAELQKTLGIDMGSEEGQESIAKKVEFFERNYTDIRAELGQHALNYINMYCEVYHKNQKAWFDFLVAGECYAYIGTNSNEPEYTILNPLDVDYDKDPDLEMVEDGDWVVVRRLMNPSTILETYGDELSDEDVDYLQDPQYRRESWLTISKDHIDRHEDDNERLIEVMQVYWKSNKMIGFLTYIDEFGDIQTELVDEDYVPDIGETVEWKWIPEVWEGHRIDNHIYLRMKPIENQRRSLDNPRKCKLPVNGRRYSDRNSVNISTVGILIPFQLMYDIYKYRMELSIAKSKDVIAEFDVSTIPKGWGFDKFLKYIDVTGIAFTDYSREGAKANPQLKRALDMTIKSIESYLALLENIRTEAELTSGIHRQRQGNVDAYAGKGVTEQSIIQSSYITEDLFRKFSRFKQRVAQGLLDISKTIWKDGKKGSYVMPDGTPEFFSVDGDVLQEAEFGVFASSDRKDIENMEIMKNLSQAFVQNGAPMSFIASILEAENLSGLKRQIEELDRIQQEQQQAMAEAEQAAKEIELQIKQADIQAQDERNIRDNQTKIQVAMLQAEQAALGKSAEIAQKASEASEEASHDSAKLAEEIRKNKAQEAISKIDLEIKRIQAKKKSSTSS